MLLGALIALPYLPILANGFVWDDIPHIAQNPRLTHVSELSTYLTQPQGLYYRPAVFFSYALEHALWSVPAGYHLTNLLLHILTAVLLATVGVRTGLSVWAAFAAALVFALHPLQTEAVAYVSGRTDLLMTAAALLSWRFLLGGGGVLERGILAALAAALAMLCKETGFAVVLVIPWVAWRLERTWRRRLSLALPAMCTAVAFWLLRPGRLPLSDAVELSHRASGVAHTTLTYAWLCAWPAHLQVDRLTALDASAAADLLALAALLAAVALSVAGLTRRGLVGDWTAWTLAFYLPVANLIPVYPAIAARAVFTPEHNLYAPLAGVGVLIALAADRLRRRLRAPQPAMITAIGVLILGSWALRTAARTLDWHDEERLYRSAILAGASSPRIWYNFGNVLLNRGAAAEAAAAFRQGLQQAPHDPDLWMNLAIALQQQGAFDDALAAYRQAAVLSPQSALVLENLGTLHIARGDLAAARDAFAAALRLDPQRAKARAALRAVDARLAVGATAETTPP